MKKILYIGLGFFALFLLLGLFGHWLNNKSKYVLQDGKVFYSGNSLRELEGADPHSFTEIPKSSYAKDKDKVFFTSWLIEGADPQSFELLPHNDYAKDKNHVYYWQKKIPGPDGSSFQFLNDPWGKPSIYGRDKNQVFQKPIFGGETLEPVKGADLKSFEVLLSHSLYPGYSTGAQYLEYARDARGVYQKGSLYEEVDAATFELLKTPDGKPSVFARDRKNIYNLIGCRPLKADRQTFEVLGEEKARDMDRDYSALTE